MLEVIDLSWNTWKGLKNSQIVLEYIPSGEAYLLAEYPSGNGPEDEKGIGRLGMTDE